jgi:hypothetical protein
VSFIPRLLRLESSGYEFELQMLIAAHELEIPISEVPIRTIYEAGNKSSHFNPIVDSMKIYFVLLRFGSVSLLTALLDNIVWYIAWRRSGDVLLSQVLARAVAVCFNYTMVRSSVFYSRERHKSVLPKYLLLVLASGTASYYGIRFFSQNVGVYPIYAKIFVETILFFVNFAVQRLFIFKPKDDTEGGESTARPLVLSAAVALAFAGLLAAEVHGFWNARLFTQDIWNPTGLKRFSRFLGIYITLAMPLLVIFPWAFAGAVAGLLAVLTIITLGGAPLAACAVFLVSTCALGSWIFGRNENGESLQTDVLCTLAGSGVYVFLMTLLARAPIHYPAVWLAVLAVPFVMDWRSVWRRLGRWRRLLFAADLRSGWERAALALVVFLLVAHWFVVLEPEKSADGLAMHLAIPANIAANHAFTLEPERVLWSVMPMGADWTYSIVYLLGGEYAARLLNFSMLVMVTALVYTAARQWIPAAAALLLAASFAATPVVQMVTGSLFIENFLAVMVMGMMTAVWRFSATGKRRYLYLAMLLAGTAMATKLGAAAFVAIALLFVIAEMVRHWRSLGSRPVVTAALAFVLLLATAAPTYVIAWKKTGNPIYPFLNHKIHSPLLDPKADFTDARYTIPFSSRALYQLTFRTSESWEGQNGSFGFQYLVIVPLALLGLLLFPQRRLTAMAAVAFGASVLIVRLQPNARYLYAAMPLVTVAFAGLAGWAFANHRGLARVLMAFLVAATALNAWFLPSSSYYHKHFCLSPPFSRAARERYLAEFIPVRKVIAWYNQAHPNATVLLTGDSTLADIRGDVYANSWHQYPVFAALHSAPAVPEMFRLLKQWRVEYFISRKPAHGEPVRPPILQELLSICATPEYEYDAYYVAKLEPDCDVTSAARRKEPTIVGSPGFYDDFDPAIVFRGSWDHDESFDGPARHTVSYTDVPGAEMAFAFEGRGLTYVFTKAPNRGVASIAIDGADQGSMDLYSPAIEWQAKRRFCCFAAGRHLLVIRVAGKADPQSSGRFVDVDGLIVE